MEWSQYWKEMKFFKRHHTYTHKYIARTNTLKRPGNISHHLAKKTSQRQQIGHKFAPDDL